MDLMEGAVLALRLGLVVVLYAFLLAVVRVARSQLDVAPAPAPAPPPRPRASELRLQVLRAGTAALEPNGALVVRDAATVGRAKGSDLELADDTVSAQHARLAPTGRGWTVRDLDSTNGTLVNGTPLRGEQSIAAGDVIAFGDVEIRVVDA